MQHYILIVQEFRFAADAVVGSITKNDDTAEITINLPAKFVNTEVGLKLLPVTHNGVVKAYSLVYDVVKPMDV